MTDLFIFCPSCGVRTYVSKLKGRPMKGSMTVILTDRTKYKFPYMRYEFTCRECKTPVRCDIATEKQKW